MNSVYGNRPMRLVPASGRSAPCVQHQTRNGDSDADLGAAPDR